MTGPTEKVIQYYDDVYQEKANEELSKLIFPTSPVKITSDLIDSNATLDMIKNTPKLFLYQSGYLTLADYESSTENSLRITNKEVLSSLTKAIFPTLKIRTQFSYEEFEAFLNKTHIFFNESLGKKKEDLNTQMHEIRDTLKKFFADSMNEVKEKLFQKIEENTNLTNYFYLFLNNLMWNTWSIADQANIFNALDDKKKPDFIFSNPKEEIEIIVEFMKNDWEKHIQRKYQEKIKSKTKKIVVIYYMLKNFEKVERFGVKCFQRDNEDLKLVFDGC